MSKHEAFLEKLRHSNEVTITVKRRTSGKDFSAPVWFNVEGQKVVLVPMKGSKSGWFKDLQREPQITLSVGGDRVSAGARPTRGSKEVERILAGFRSKYESVWSDSYYTNRDVFVEIPL